MDSPALKRKFVRILRVELEDLDDHVQSLVEDYQCKFAAHRETEHVCLENIATLRNEASGIHRFIQVLDALEVGPFEGLDDLVEGVRKLFQDSVRKAGLAPCACVYADRKICKVLQYLRAVHGGDAVPAARDTNNTP